MATIPFCTSFKCDKCNQIKTNERTNEWTSGTGHGTLHYIAFYRIGLRTAYWVSESFFLVSHVAASRHNYSNPVAKLKWMECKWTILMRSCRNDWKRCSFQAVQISTSDISVEQIENALNICLILKVQSWYADASKWFSAVKACTVHSPNSRRINDFYPQNRFDMHVSLIHWNRFSNKQWKAIIIPKECGK